MQRPSRSRSVSEMVGATPDCIPWSRECDEGNAGASQADGIDPAPTEVLQSTWQYISTEGIPDTQPLPISDGIGFSITQSSDSGPKLQFTTFGPQTSTVATAPTTSQAQIVAPSIPTSVTTSNPNLETIGTVAAISDGNESKGMSAGAVTGVAIGTFITGAALAFVAAFFLFKQRNKHKNTNVSTKDYPSYADSAPDLAMIQHKSVGSLGGRHSPYVQVSQTPVPASPAPAPSPPVLAPIALRNESSKDVTSFLPPAADDDEVWNGVSHLFDLMHEHVEKFYRDVHASITPSMEPELAKFGVKDVDMAELLQECSSPTAALKHALVAYVLSITGPKQKGDREGTLFPEELAHVANGTDVGSDPDFTAATSLHRRVSVYLYSTLTGYPNRRKSWMSRSNTREAAEHFSLTFFPWANPTSSDQDRDEDLARIITDTLTVRIWLFGQLDAYEFEWEGVGGRGVVVNPGLVKRRWRGSDGDGDEGGGRVHVVEGAVVAM